MSFQKLSQSFSLKRTIFAKKSPIKEKPLKLELYSKEQLERHATALAARHEIASKAGPDYLINRLQENEAVLLDVNEKLNETVHAKEIISPAGEWLLDNFHVIEEQIRIARFHLPEGFSKELPHLKGMSSFPRVYDIALEIIAHVDGRVDNENISAFIRAYQQRSPLKLGEFWAIPIMLRLALLENLRRVAVLVKEAIYDRRTANKWADLLIKCSETDEGDLILVTADMARSRPSLSTSFVAEFVRRIQGQNSMEIPLSWIETQLSNSHLSSQQSLKLEGQQQAANQVSVGASIASLRTLNAIDWKEFVSSQNFVELALLKDPMQIYGKMDFVTRDRYRHAIEKLARKSRLSEWEIAEKVVELSSLMSPGSVKSHVGYHLLDEGKNNLDEAVIQNKKYSFDKSKLNTSHKCVLYFSSISIFTISVSAFVGLYIRSQNLPLTFILGICFLLLFPASQSAISFTNWVTTIFAKPSFLPRLDFLEGIPAEFKTVVVIPCLLVTKQNIDDLLESLEVRYLSNRDKNLHFALATDFADAKTEKLPNDEELFKQVEQGIQLLNEKYKSKSGDFFLFHRPREWNPEEKLWMGYERKRGKLCALNSLLRNKKHSFSQIVGNIDVLKDTKFVITLDADTQIPIQTAKQLIGTLAHPLNRPEIDVHSKSIIRGYGILQPRVAVSLAGSRKSWFARIYSGDAGVDPYTQAVSDIYQDLFKEGSFVGKGIYDIDAFATILEKRFPENIILSHDLLEGCFARSGFASDILLYEEHPSHIGEDAMRRHRWMRGDWQIHRWLFDKQLSKLSKWKIFDNLRRSIIPIASILVLIAGWSTLPTQFLTSLILILIFLVPLFTSLAGALRKPSETALRSHMSDFFKTTTRNIIHGILFVVFLPYEAYLSLDAIFRSLTRLYVTKRNLLQWNSASDPRSLKKTTVSHFIYSMISVPIFCITLFFLSGVFNENIKIQARVFLVLWTVSPFIATWLSLPISAKNVKLSQIQIKFLRHISRRTWRFFETFVGQSDNWLPPDNFQEYPTPVIAHRTSPTNIGLLLLSNLSAYDFGYLSTSSLIKRTSLTFQTMERMERFRGHFYNWYDTQTLAPLPPTYVSTVDSGNLAGFLLTLKPGLKDLLDEKIIPRQMFEGLIDTLEELATEISDTFIVSKDTSSIEKQIICAIDNLRQELLKYPSTVEKMAILVCHVNTELGILKQLLQMPEESGIAWWFNAFESQFKECVCEPIELLQSILNFKLYLLNNDDTIPSLKELALFSHKTLENLDEALKKSDKLELHNFRTLILNINERVTQDILQIEKLCQQCDELAAMEYEFLYDKSRHLLAIGYNVSEHRRDAGFYDLLASEARLCSFVAIAQGLIPQENWFALGRLLTKWGNESVLLSWSGSMFEYLMPLLVMPTYPNTILDETYLSAVRRQISYGKQRRVPWGLSESGYNATDCNLNYQYKAFGVPGLGFKRGLANDLVIAPYATVMALMILPQESYKNLKRLSHDNYEGKFGFYEAVDFTESRLAPEQNKAIVKSFMAHHQGMSFLALGYSLLDRKMQKRFQSEPLFQALELLLQEKVAKAAPFYPHASEASEAAKRNSGNEPSLRVITTPHTSRPEVHLLSNGRYSVVVTNSGGGFSRWKDLTITRWREDPTCDNWGNFCFVTDVSSGDVWSAAYHPSLKESSYYEAIFPQGRAEFRRRDNEIEMHTEVTVSPEDDIELRRMSITNLSSRRRVLELTAYAEVVLTTQAADESHPAFSNLFVQTEIVSKKQAILCTRRPRSDKEAPPTLFYLMNVHGKMEGEASFETDRMKFLGRGNSISRPAALEKNNMGNLAGSAGSVLDPIVAIRCRIVLEPEESIKVDVVIGVSDTKIGAHSLLNKYDDRHVADRVFDLAWTHRQVLLHQLNIIEADAQIYGRLASSLIYTNPTRRANPTLLSKNRRGQSGLWGYGISGDLPIVLLRVKYQEKIEIVRQMIQAHSYWHTMGLAVDLVIWNEDDSGYRQDLHNQITALIMSSPGIDKTDKAAGIFIRRPDQMSEEDRILLQTTARAIISDSDGSLRDQVRRRSKVNIAIPDFVPSVEKIGQSENLKHENFKDQVFDNEIGEFSKDGREYVIKTSTEKRTPAPWSNVLANKFFGSVVSESGAAYSWCENAHEFRLTPWHNDPVNDSSGEAFFIRDEESGESWSPSALPMRGKHDYLTRHGFGYSVFEYTQAGIQTHYKTFVAIDAPVKISSIKIKNISSASRKISLTGYCEWVLGELRSKTLMHVITEIDPSTNALFAQNPYHGEFESRLAFFNSSESNRTVTCDRTEFLGRNGHISHPAAMHKTHLSGKVGAGLDPCAAIQTLIELEPNAEHEIIFVLGVGRDVEDMRTLLRRFCKAPLAAEAFEEVNQFWAVTLETVQIDTPDKGINTLANGWLLYQTISSRIWGRSGYYQSGGAFGFRDQLQDFMALLHTEPGLMREHILRCAAHQFREGDVQHWWHPPSGKGVRTQCSDDYLWLPLATCRYVLGIGDTGILDVRVKFLEGRHLKPDEEAYYDVHQPSEESATLYNHCVRAINHGLKFGEHGLPLIGFGDWNDGMNLVGEHGKGESVWLAFFMFDVLSQFAKVALLYNDPIFSEYCLQQAQMLQKNVEKNAWDGQWYRRAYFDDGTPLGSSNNEECQIDSLPQSWSVISGAGDKDRSREAMNAVDTRLVDRKNGLIKLFDPPFDKSNLNPGYIKGYVPGVRENGGQYTHAAVWSAMAFAALGDQERTWELMNIMNPINHGKTSEDVSVYRVEPYVVAADVYGVYPLSGRGGWTWYTGSAAWMYRLILESILGVKLEVDKLYFNPCVPKDWKHFNLQYRYQSTNYNITVELSGLKSSPAIITKDGVKQMEEFLVLLDDHDDHLVTVTI